MDTQTNLLISSTWAIAKKLVSYVWRVSGSRECIFNHQKAVELTDDGHPSKPSCLASLGSSQRSRFLRLRELVDLENAISNTRKAVNLTGTGHPDLSRHLFYLGICQESRFEFWERRPTLRPPFLLSKKPRI